jgi:hypothetical protein
MKEKYEILPAPIERIIDVATRLGRFLSPQTTELYLSEHIKHEPTDGEAMTGAEAMLTRFSNQPVLDGWDDLGWTDMGEYLDRDSKS